MTRHFSLTLLLTFSATAFVLSACTVGPDYKRPTVAMPVKFKEAKGKKVITSKNKDWKVAEPNDGFDRGEWWKIFHDSQLNELEAQLNINNQTIATAYANYKQARDLVDEARAAYYPTLIGSAAFSRSRGTSNTSSSINSSSTGSTSISPNSSTFGSAAPTQIIDSHSIIFNATWVPDIWGLVHRTVEASAAGAQASASLLALTRLSAQGSLAQYYFELRALDSDQKILDGTVVAYRKILQLTKNQYAAGVASQGDILQAESALQAEEALAINNGVNRAIYEHAIAVLIGKPAADFSLHPRPLTAIPPPIPVALPSTLLERRPDVAQAERLMAQANANIGVAIAAYYPTLSLTATGSFFGRGLSHWISLPALNWAYGPQLSETLYDGGLRWATVEAARAAYESTVASYRQVVLAALQNVEDNLATLRILDKQEVMQIQAAKTAKKALQFVINEYKAGTQPYSSVLSAQTTAFTAEKAVADVNGLRMTAAVGLIIALGGGWDATSIAEAANVNVNSNS